MRRTISISILAAAAVGAAATAQATNTNTTSTDDGDARAAIRADLAQHRAKALDALHAYWVGGNFPINVYREKMVNIFRDGAGRLCAVANLIHQSGRDDLVTMQVKADNYIALRDLRGGAIADWIAQSGLTREELVDLQGAGYEFQYKNINVEGPRGQMIVLDNGNQILNVVPAPAYREIAEKAALRTRLSAAEQKLRATSDASLDLATARVVAARVANAHAK